MKRREFLQRTGLVTVLIAGGFSFGRIPGGTEPPEILPLGPRPRQWVEAWRRNAVSYLIDGSHSNWLPPYTQPSRARGWRLVERIPLNLRLVVEEERLPEENQSLKERFRYGYSIMETHLGSVRVDYLERNLGCVYPKLFLLNHEGKELGGCGIFHRPLNHVYRDFPSGIRQGEQVFQVTGLRYPGEKKREVMGLSVWERLRGD